MFFSRVRPQSCRFNVVIFFVESTEQCFNKISSVNSSNLKKTRILSQYCMYVCMYFYLNIMHVLDIYF